MDKEQLAPKLYQEYSLSLGNNHLIMPDWEELSPEERSAWVEVARFVIMDICL